MKSQLQDRIEHRFGKMTREHPEYGDAVTKAWDLLARYRIPANQWLTDSFFQERGGHRLRDVDMLFYSELMSQLLKGHLFYTGIDVHCPPMINPKENLLNEITLAAVASPFEIGFEKGNGHRQPLLTWHEPVTVHSHREGLDDAPRQVEPGSALLSVGYTRAIRTGLSLREHRVLARWPLGHRFIYVLWTDLEGLFEGMTDLPTWLNDRI